MPVFMMHTIQTQSTIEDVIIQEEKNMLLKHGFIHLLVYHCALMLHVLIIPQIIHKAFF